MKRLTLFGLALSVALFCSSTFGSQNATQAELLCEGKELSGTLHLIEESARGGPSVSFQISGSNTRIACSLRSQIAFKSLSEVEFMDFEVCAKYSTDSHLDSVLSSFEAIGPGGLVIKSSDHEFPRWICSIQ